MLNKKASVRMPFTIRTKVRFRFTFINLTKKGREKYKNFHFSSKIFAYVMKYP